MRKGSALDLLTKHLRRRELETHKAVLRTFGVDYEAEKQKQEAIYAALQKRKGRRSKRKRKVKHKKTKLDVTKKSQ